MKPVFSLAVVMALAGAGTALADDDCASPKSTWQARDAAIAHVQTLGLSADRVEIDDGCYEIRGRDSDGNRIELKLDPASLALVKLEVKFLPGSDPARYLPGALGQAGAARTTP